MNRDISSATEMDAWLRDGGIVVTASERAARALTAAFHRARRAEGLTAWPSPKIHDWQTFVRNTWNEQSRDGRIVLNNLQERSIWARIVAEKAPDAARLEGARQRLADLAMDAHNLLCAYAPRFLKESTRAGWAQDAAAFSNWLTAFDEACGKIGLVSTARLALEMIPLLEADSRERPPLLLAGFDRNLPAQEKFFDAWGKWNEIPLDKEAERIQFYQAADPAAELAACALWCKLQLAGTPRARLLVVTQDVSERRGEIERAFLRFAGPAQSASGSRFEFSLGVPLGQMELARGAGFLLRWLDGALDEHEVDWLFATGQTDGSAGESHALTAFMRALRDRGLERTSWALADFLTQRPRETLPPSWSARMRQAQARLKEFARTRQSPFAWAELVPRLLEITGWPGMRTLASAEFQTLQRWQQTLDDCASLGFDGRRIDWKEFLEALTRAADETLFAPESQDAQILIAGAAESAGLEADAIWFVGASEDAWPASGATHPLLPLAVQREAAMPHSSAKLDWDVAAAMTRRLLTSAPEIHFSYARQSEGIDARPSRLIVQVAGQPGPLASELTAAEVSTPITVAFEDASRVPFPAGSAPGGAGILTAQSQCPFKAFAIARLGAEAWEPAEAGLNARERGQLLHDVLHSIWGGPPHGIRTQAELIAVADLSSFVESHVRRVLAERMPSRARESMPRRYLELEETRLAGLVVEWLRYEATRVAFTVVETESQSAASINGLTLKLRLDRIDRLIDGALLVVDYKSGEVSAKSWDLPRPDDVQLPLYGCFALDAAETCGGLVFAKVRAGENKREFAGRVRDAKSSLHGELTNRSALVQKPLDSHALMEWRSYIEELARDFLLGQADVDPREYPDTCERCGLQALCRVLENPPRAEDESDEGDDDV